ncbi:MAG TPA: hypothetical protein VOB72_04490 [Candidatus Dormibacteraeota bacterium]|nr:hypothetical protein [Candidatus Dormibacteraeota bacterium]
MEVALPAGAQLAHRLPGRFRVRFPSGAAAEGWTLALRVADHPAVTSVRWGGASRSMAVEHDPSVPAARILAENRLAALRHAPMPARVRVEPLARAALLALVPGVVQFVLTLVGSLIASSAVPRIGDVTLAGPPRARPARR